MSPKDLMCDESSHITDERNICGSGKGEICYLDDVRVSKCKTGEVLRTGGGDHQSRDDQEEACLRQVTVWADLNHPHVAKLLGACRIGKEPFVVHEPLVANRASAQSWEPLRGWALGLQYLHERELGYKNFSDNRLLARQHVTTSGVLSGLGLVPVKRQSPASLQRGLSNTLTLQSDNEVILHDLHAPMWSVPNDIFAFGLAIYNTLQRVSMYNDEKVTVLPPERPQFLNEQEWDLVERMCTERRVSMWYVVHQLQAYVKATESKVADKKSPVDLSVSMDPEDDLSDSTTEETHTPPVNIDDFIVPKMNEKLEKAMPRLERMHKDMPEASKKMLQHVVDRLNGVRVQLQTRAHIKDPATVMEGFVDILDLFYDLLTRRDLGKELPSSSVIVSFCASREAAQNVANFHHEIDRLLTLGDLRNTSSSAQTLRTHVTLADSREDSSDPIDTTPDTQDFYDWQIKCVASNFVPFKHVSRTRKN